MPAMNKHELLVQAMIADGVELIDAGNHYKALCPFHEEKTPSLILYKHRDRYRCMGCGARGDVIDYVCETKGMSFSRAVRYLGLESEENRYIVKRPGILDTIIEQERQGVDVVKVYGRTLINGLLQQEIRRLVSECDSKKKDVTCEW